jgi:hypothetical protein
MTATSIDDLQDKLSSEFGEAVQVSPAQEVDSIDGVLPQVVAAPREEVLHRRLSRGVDGKTWRSHRVAAAPKSRPVPSRAACNLCCPARG